MNRVRGAWLLVVTVAGFAGAAATTLREEELLHLAAADFGSLTPAEENLFHAAARGETARCNREAVDAVDPSEAHRWGDDRIIRVKCIAWLCTDPVASKLVSYRGLQVTGARFIEGTLDLDEADIPFSLHLQKCSFDGPISLRRATAPNVYLDGSHTRGILADGLKVKGNVCLRDGFSSAGEVRLTGATIGGNLDCSDGVFEGNGGEAIKGDMLRVDGNVYLRRDKEKSKFLAEGGIRLVCAAIRGYLVCSGGQFHARDGMAFAADGLKVQGDACLEDGFCARGIVTLIGATVGGDLNCIGGQFLNRGGYALAADCLKVGGSVFLRGHPEDRLRITAEGEVRFPQAVIGKDLDCTRGQFVNPGGYAIRGEGAVIGGCAAFIEGFRPQGRVCFAAAQVGKEFAWRRVRSPEDATLDLRCARIGVLVDEEGSWPSSGRLFLHGLVYDQIGDEAHYDVRTRIRWLHLQPTDCFWPQPYEQLAKVLQAQGREWDAAEVQIAKNEDRAPHLRWGSRIWHWILRFTLAYGYDPWRPLWGALFFVVLGFWLFRRGFRKGLMTSTCEKREERFSAFMYSVDLLLPIVALHQDDAWWPNAMMGRRGWGWWLRVYAWIHIAAGWAITSFLVAGLSGLVRS